MNSGLLTWDTNCLPLSWIWNPSLILLGGGLGARSPGWPGTLYIYQASTHTFLRRKEWLPGGSLINQALPPNSPPSFPAVVRSSPTVLLPMFLLLPLLTRDTWKPTVPDIPQGLVCQNLWSHSRGWEESSLRFYVFPTSGSKNAFCQRVYPNLCSLGS